MWMHFSAEAPSINDSGVPDDFSPAVDTNINWVHTRITPDDIDDSASTSLDQLNITHAYMQRVVEEIDQSMLNEDPKFVVCIVEHQVLKSDSQPIFVVGGNVTG